MMCFGSQVQHPGWGPPTRKKQTNCGATWEVQREGAYLLLDDWLVGVGVGGEDSVTTEVSVNTWPSDVWIK